MPGDHVMSYAFALRSSITIIEVTNSAGCVLSVLLSASSGPSAISFRNGKAGHRPLFFEQFNSGLRNRRGLPIPTYWAP